MSKRTSYQIDGPFVPLLIETIDSPAWRAMSHGAQMLYIALKRRHNSTFNNNGKIFLPQRQAATELRSHADYVTRWFRELQHYGFIVMTAYGCLGVDGKGKAPHWRLTELNHNGEPPSREFALWNGVPFQEKKQNPVPQKWDAPSHKSGTSRHAKAGHLREKVYRKSGTYPNPKCPVKTGQI
jgi:hypothetical protein